MVKGLMSGTGKLGFLGLIASFAAVIFLLVTVGPVGQAYGQAKGSAAKTVRVGYVLSVSGWFSVFDSAEEQNLKVVAQIINDRGGIKVKGERYNIELVGEDGKSTMDGTAAGATKLVFDHKVKFVAGPMGFFAPASSPVFEQNKVIHVSGFNVLVPGDMDKSTPYGFLGFNAAMGSSMASMKVIKKEYPNTKKVGVLMADDGSIPYMLPKIKKMMADNGMTLAGEVVPFPNEMEDFSPIAAKLNAIKDADAYFMFLGSPVAVGLVAKGLRALGNDKPLVHQGAPHVKEIMAICGKDAADNIISFGPTPHAKGNPPLLDEVYDRSVKIRNLPSWYLLTPNGLWVMAKVIEAANSLDPAVVKAKWETMDKVDCVYGTCTFGGDETYGLKHHAVSHPMSYSKLVKGQVVYGGWVDPGPIP
jgi:branched-chain amino acid transport system substrate-binding protein